ncbi:MAG: hypothetical protein JJ899_04775 [Alphaproteobacteria bacterium]|nr:hypothetical protein [Alphaproteobacteria bacterium]
MTRRTPSAPGENARKAHDRSLALTLAGIVFLMPPVAAVFLVEGTLAGIPLPLAAVFAVWIFLVAGAYLLRPALQAAHDLENPTSRAPDDD